MLVILFRIIRLNLLKNILFAARYNLTRINLQKLLKNQNVIVEND